MYDTSPLRLLGVLGASKETLGFRNQDPRKAPEETQPAAQVEATIPGFAYHMGGFQN